MARMYSRKKGKSGSKRPEFKKPVWLSYDNTEVEQLILKLAKGEKTPSEIGSILKDQYGIPLVKSLLNKKITKILKDNKFEPKLPEDLTNLIKNYIKVSAHFEKNKKDKSAFRGIQLAESKIHRLSKYYTKNKTLPKDWKFERDKAKLLIG